jgi:hypothetical protein
MARVFNFSAGPSTLPVEVLEQVQSELLDWRGTGMSVMEMSHRSPAFESIIRELEADLRSLIGIPDSYAVLFLQGGATQQFFQVPMAFLGDGYADYIITGEWGKKAYETARPFGKVNVPWDGADTNYNRLPVDFFTFQSRMGRSAAIFLLSWSQSSASFSSPIPSINFNGKACLPVKTRPSATRLSSASVRFRLSCTKDLNQLKESDTKAASAARASGLVGSNPLGAAFSGEDLTSSTETPIKSKRREKLGY